MTNYPVINLHATGNNITKLRKRQGYSVAELQDYLGFEHPNAIYKWQKGMSLPTVDNLLALSVLFKVSMNEILVYNDQDFLLSRLNHRFVVLNQWFDELFTDRLYNHFQKQLI